MNTLEVSVIMSCYNSEATLRRAIDSILNQTFTNFEFVIIEDGSVDNTLNILENYERIDNRIMLLKNDKNIGLAASLNRGIKQARGVLIARMDADDEAYNDRLENQVSFLKKNKQIDILGTAIKERTSDGKELGIRRLPQQHKNIVERIFRKPLVYHPTIMIRRSVYNRFGKYDPTVIWAEDADLWYRIYDQVTFHNLPEPLLYYQIKEKLSFKQARYNLKVKYDNLRDRRILLRYIPQLIKDTFILSLKMIRYNL